jgi:hypothetical protein
MVWTCISRMNHWNVRNASTPPSSIRPEAHRHSAPTWNAVAMHITPIAREIAGTLARLCDS